jgi:hypothetical protein
MIKKKKKEPQPKKAALTTKGPFTLEKKVLRKTPLTG